MPSADPLAASAALLRSGAPLTVPDDLDTVATRLEPLHPADVVRWAFDRFGSALVTTASFEDAVLVHLAATCAPGTDVVLLDTQYLFAETAWYADRVTRRLGIPLHVERPAVGVVADDRWEADVDGCCGVRKVAPLARVLEGRAAWLTGIRRVDGPTRADAPVVQWDARRQLVKVNPIVTWSDDDLALYEALHELPRHPLKDKGYVSIGCWPCTRPVAAGEDRRAGRWSGQIKTECGLHA
jgi:phosphoadenosine phosphosulfate reductase